MNEREARKGILRLNLAPAETYNSAMCRQYLEPTRTGIFNNHFASVQLKAAVQAHEEQLLAIKQRLRQNAEIIAPQK